jgi:hypothetical protein
VLFAVLGRRLGAQAHLTIPKNAEFMVHRAKSTELDETTCCIASAGTGAEPVAETISISEIDYTNQSINLQHQQKTRRRSLLSRTK